MSKLTKSQRRKQRKKREKEAKKRKRQKMQREASKVKPYEQVKLKMFEMPNPFGDMPMEKRREIIRQMGAKAKQDFDDLYPKIKQWLIDYDPVYILSYCAAYFLSTPEGIDKEAIEGKLDFYHHYLEILQAFALTTERSMSPKPLLQEAEKLEDDMKKVGLSIQLKSFDLPSDITDDELTKEYVLSKIRSQTMAIRNWAYPAQAVEITKKLFSKLSKEINNKYGVDPVMLVDVLVKILEELENKLNDHFDKLRPIFKERDYKKMYERYCESFPEIIKREGDAEKIFDHVGNDINQFRGSMIAHADLRLSDVYTFDIDEIANLYGDKDKKNDLEKIFDLWSFEFGDLKEYNIEHFILDNPVLRQPFIKLDDKKYFCPIMGIFGHFLLTLMESLVAADEVLREKYEKIKSDFLERETEGLFRKKFPSARIFRNTIWNDGVKDYETDLIIILDNFILVVECKAGKITPSAKRGAELRVIKTLDELVVNASQQANRFIDFLKKNKKEHKLKSNTGEFILDNRETNYFIPLSVTFENFGTVTSNINDAVKAGLIVDPPNPFVPSIPFSDLEIIFELLENEVQYLHYFVRRADFEKNLLYEADELDLLGFYLDNAFNIGDFEFGGKRAINLTMKSKELDPYFTAQAVGKIIKKPKLELSKWWKDIIDRLIERKPPRWLEMGYILLNVPKEDQIKFETKLNELKEKIIKGKVEHKFNWAVMETVPKERSYYIVGLPYTTNDREEKNKLIEGALNETINRNKDLLGGLCIAVSYIHSEYPYGTIAYIPSNVLNR